MYRKKSTAEHRPLAESPQYPRARRVLCSNSTIQTPAASLIKSQVPNRTVTLDGSRICPEFQSISCKLQALAKMVGDEICTSVIPDACTASNVHSSPSFARGRLYYEYSARRNEKLKRKKVVVEERTSAAHNPGVLAVEFGKRNTKKTETVRKSVPANFTLDCREGLRSSARISKENKKPHVLGNITRGPSIDGINKRISTRSVRRN